MEKQHINTCNISDENIVISIKNGDIELFGVLMKRYTEKLIRYGKRFLSNIDNIDDIVQDIFIKTYQHIQSFDTSLKFSSWIYRIAHNAFVNGLKKQQKSYILMPDFDLDVFISHHMYRDPKKEEKEYAELLYMIELGLDKLPLKYKEIIILHHLEGLSYKDISDILKIPTGTVGIRVMRAKKQLHDIYTTLGITKDIYEK